MRYFLLLVTFFTLLVKNQAIGQLQKPDIKIKSEPILAANGLLFKP